MTDTAVSEGLKSLSRSSSSVVSPLGGGPVSLNRTPSVNSPSSAPLPLGNPVALNRALSLPESSYTTLPACKPS